MPKTDSAPMAANRSKTVWTVLLVALLVALLSRGAVMAWRFGQLQQDPDAYRILAENLAQHKVLGGVDADGNRVPTAFRPPGYPWLLSWFVFDGKLSPLSVAELHIALGFLTIALTYRIGRQLLPRRGALLATLLVAIDPILLGQSTLVMTETVSTFLSALAWWFYLNAERELNDHESSRRLTGWALAMGLALAAGYLCRPVFIVWAGFILIMLSFRAIAFERRRVWMVASIGGMILLAVSLWTFRNARVMGKPIWATTHGGYTLLLGNNPSFYEYLRTGRFGEKWDASFFHARWGRRIAGDPTSAEFWSKTWEVDAKDPDGSENESFASDAFPPELEDDALAYATAKAAIKREPEMFIYSSFVRLGRLWSPMPHAGDYHPLLRYAVGGYYAAMMLACAIGIWRLGRILVTPAWLAMLLLAVALSGVHSIYWSNMRMRALAVPLLAMLASASLYSRPEPVKPPEAKFP
ncbi:MAG: glycosyltransferase family 39 protein [Pirellulaceae bacterium]